MRVYKPCEYNTHLYKASEYLGLSPLLGYLSQMLLLELPDALPVCQTMLITWCGGFY